MFITKDYVLTLEPSPLLLKAEEGLFLGLTKSDWVKATISVAILIFASMQLCGTLPLSGYTFSFVAIGAGTLTLFHALVQIRQKDHWHLMISALALLTLGLLSCQNHLLSPNQLACGLLGIATYCLAILLIDHKIRKQAYKVHERAYILGHSKTIIKEPWLPAKATLLTALVLLVLAALKLTHVLNSPLGILATTAGSAALLTTAYRHYQRKAKHDLRDEWLLSIALIVIGTLTLTQQLSSWQAAQAVLGITSSYLALGLLFQMGLSREAKSAFWKQLQQQSLQSGKAKALPNKP